MPRLLTDEEINKIILETTIARYYYIYPAGNWKVKDENAQKEWVKEVEIWLKPSLVKLEAQANLTRLETAREIFKWVEDNSVFTGREAGTMEMKIMKRWWQSLKSRYLTEGK